MKLSALLSFVCLSAAIVPTVHASGVNPLGDNYNITVGNTVLTNANANFNSTSGLLTFNIYNGLSVLTETYTFLETSAPPLIDALSVTHTCLAVNTTGCTGKTVSVNNASVLNDTIQGSLSVGVTLQAAAAGSANAGVSKLIFADTAVAGTQTAVVGYQAQPTNSPVPEPGTVSMVLSGVLGMAAAARRRLARV